MKYDVLEICRHIINYSNEKDYGISNLKLQKILYFVQAYFLLEKNIPCFTDKIEAWNFGPVVPKAYIEYSQYGSGDIPTINSYLVFDENNIWNTERVAFDDNVIQNNDKKLINKVIDKFANYSATDLVYITQKQSPWFDNYISNRNCEISLESIKSYFTK